MARRQPAREQALSEIRAKRATAARKVKRLQGQGVNTSDIDPRVSSSALAAMSTRQLQSHLRRLNSFTSRSNQYVAGWQGAPLNARTGRAYLKAQRTYNEKSAAFNESIHNLVIPTLNLTVGEYLGKLRTGDKERGITARRDGDYRTFGTVERSLSNITSEKSLQTLLQQMQPRAATDYLEKEAKLQRRIVRKMLERTGNRRLLPAIREMSDEELIVLTQYTEFMSALANSYAMSMSTHTDKPRYQSSVFENNEDIIDTLVDWAHKHFSDAETSEQDADAPRKPTRDRYGRFVRKDQPNPEPVFQRDEQGRFAKHRAE